MTRFIPKQFAENSTTSVVFGSFQEQGGNVGDGTISSDPATLQGGTAWPLGWSAATDNFLKIPRGEEMEGLERVLSAAIIQQFIDGQTFWQPEMPVRQYQTIVQYQTGSDLPKLYVNITGTSTSTPPDSDTTNWYMFLDTGASSANVDLSNLTNGLANTICTTPATTTSTASSARPAVVIENYVNGTSWYRKWSDGWIEQGAREYIDASFSQVINFIKPYENIPQIEVTLNGNITSGATTINSGVAQLAGSATNVDGNGFTLIKTSNAYANGFYAWKAQGR